MKRTATILFCAGLSMMASAQSITIPAHSFTQTITINGKATKVTITEPAQTVKIPAPTLPAGLTFANGVLTVSGSIKASSINLTGGPGLPTSANGLYLLQLKGGFLQPVPYVPYTPPAIADQK